MNDTPAPQLGADGKPVGGTPAAPPGPWYAGKLDAELTGHLQNQGLHDKSAEDVALAMIKNHREAEKKIGIPADQVLRMPKDAADPQWDTVYAKLGIPKDPKEFAPLVKAVKFKDGSEVDDALTDAVSQAAAKFHAPKDAVSEITKALVAHLDKQEESDVNEAAAKLATEKGELAKNWGTNHDTNLFIARKGAAALGFTPEVVSALEKAAGYKAVMEAMLNVGQRLGEAKWVDNGNPGLNNGVLTRDQAVAKLGELKSDKAWVGRYLSGDRDAKREFESLTRLATPQQ